MDIFFFVVVVCFVIRFCLFFFFNLMIRKLKVIVMIEFNILVSLIFMYVLER